MLALALVVLIVSILIISLSLFLDLFESNNSGIITGKVFETPQKQQIDTQQIKIGVIAPLSGPLSRQGEWMRNGVNLAYAELNSVNKKHIRLVFEDSECKPQSTTTALNKLINIDNIEAYIGPFCGSPEFAAMEVSKNTRTIALTPSSNYGKQNNYFFSTQTLLTKEPEKLAEFAYNNLGISTAAILYFNNDFGLFTKNAFKKKFEQLGGVITNTETINSFTQKDFRTELTKIKSNNPDGIFIAYASLGNIVNQVRILGIKSRLLSTFGVETPENLRIAGKNLEGAVYTYKGTSQNKLSQKQLNFIKKYREKYGEEPGMIAAESYDAYMILVSALADCLNTNSRSDCLKDNILSTSYSGASGQISYNKTTYGVNKPIIIKTVKEGKFIEYMG